MQQIFPASPSLTHTSHCFRLPKLPLDNDDCVIFDQGALLSARHSQVALHKQTMISIQQQETLGNTFLQLLLNLAPHGEVTSYSRLKIICAEAP